MKVGSLEAGDGLPGLVSDQDVKQDFAGGNPESGRIRWSDGTKLSGGRGGGRLWRLGNAGAAEGDGDAAEGDL